ncbi:MAG: hypothetical protein FWG10_11720 [Eubacteriaceae bacterium]|nr:hypothetical protein [Eubacteriaceae bacterium]
MNNCIRMLSGQALATSEFCLGMQNALAASNGEEYAKLYKAYCDLYTKGKLRDNRSVLLDKLRPAAPDWATAIGNREGIHGTRYAPKPLWMLGNGNRWAPSWPSCIPRLRIDSNASKCSRGWICGQRPESCRL